MTCAVLLNLDGTLTENTVDYKQIYYDALEQADITGLEDTYEAYTEKFFTYFQNGWAFPRRQAILDMLNEHNIDDLGHSDAFGTAWEDLEAEQTTFRPESADVVKTLSAHHPVAIATNGTSRLQRMKLEDSGIAQHLQATVISTEIGKNKPNSEFFETARNAVDADTCIVVSHDLRRDLLPAKRLGMKTIWVSESDTEDNQKIKQLVDERVHDLEALPDAVDRLCSE